MDNEIFNEENSELLEDDSFIIHNVSEQDLDMYEPEWRLEIDLFNRGNLLH